MSGSKVKKNVKRKPKGEAKLRPSAFLDSLGPNRVRKTLLHAGSLRKAAKALDVQYITLWNWLKNNDVPRGGYEINYTKNIIASVPRRGTFQYWLLSHQDIKLPRSHVKISKISGHTEDSIKCFFYRQRKEIRELLKNLPDLKTADTTIQTSDHKIIHTSTIKDYKYTVDRYSLRVTISGTLSDKSSFEAWITSLEEYAKSLKK